MNGILSTLALALGVGWCAGLNLYATLAILGLLHRFVPEFVLPPGLEVLGSYWVIGPAVFMYFVEFVADKVPAFDSVWDSVHTFIRVPAGAVLAAMALGDVPLELQIAAGLLGGTLALGSHATKATTRLVAHSSGTSPIVTPVASLLEDGLVFTTFAVWASYPILSIILVAAMIAVAVVLLWAFWAFTRKVFQLISGRKPDKSVPGVPA